jgi:hypothetical protein
VAVLSSVSGGEGLFMIAKVLSESKSDKRDA